MTPNRPCLDCGHLTTTTRCGPCQYARNAQLPRTGSTRAWRRLRALILQRDNYTCTYCGAPANHVDHIQPISRGGPLHDPRNLTSACATCNLTKGSRPA